MFPNASSDLGQRIGGTIIQATVGGLATVAGGGKFANGAITGAFQYLATTTLSNPSAEATSSSPSPDDALYNSNYAKTVVTFFGKIEVDYLDGFNSLDPISQQSVVVHEQVHVDQLTPFVVDYCPLGCFALMRAASFYDGANNMELQTFQVQLSYLNSQINAVPQSQRTTNYQAANVFRGLVEANLFTAQQIQQNALAH